MRIRVKLGSDDRIESYMLETLDKAKYIDDYLSVEIDDKYIDKIENLENGKLVSSRYEVNDIFKKNYKNFKIIENKLVSIEN